MTTKKPRENAKYDSHTFTAVLDVCYIKINLDNIKINIIGSQICEGLKNIFENFCFGKVNYCYSK